MATYRGQNVATSSYYEAAGEEKIKGRKSGFHKVVSQREVICPAPRRMPSFLPFHGGEQRLGSNKERHASTPGSGEPVCEILDIFLSKSVYGDQASSVPYFSGSPPSRSQNPLIHDVQFNKKALQSTVNASQKSSCGASFGSSPSVRIEGFACSSSEQQCIVSALA